MDPNGYGMTMLSWNIFALGGESFGIAPLERIRGARIIGSMAKRQRQLAYGMHRTGHP